MDALRPDPTIYDGMPLKKMQNPLLWAGVMLLVFGGPVSSAERRFESLREKARAEQRPNIIFILADDLGYGDLGCYGQKRIKTPNLDRMAAEGMRFTQCYAGSTVCAPSRSALLTGQHTGHTRIRGNARYPLSPEDVTVAEVLKSAGYRTALIGKWGLGEADTTGVPNRQGFDYFFGYLNQRHAHNYYPSFLWRSSTQHNLDDHAYPIDRNLYGNKQVYSHNLFAN